MNVEGIFSIRALDLKKKKKHHAQHNREWWWWGGGVRIIASNLKEGKLRAYSRTVG